MIKEPLKHRFLSLVLFSKFFLQYISVKFLLRRKYNCAHYFVRLSHVKIYCHRETWLILYSHMLWHIWDAPLEIPSGHNTHFYRHQSPPSCRTCKPLISSERHYSRYTSSNILREILKFPVFKRDIPQMTVVIFAGNFVLVSISLRMEKHNNKIFRVELPRERLYRNFKLEMFRSRRDSFVTALVPDDRDLCPRLFGHFSL